jgi:hypothetical protein
MSPDKPANQILFEYLCNRQKQISDDYNAMDQKFAQIIAYNGVILSVLIIGIQRTHAWNMGVCLIGVGCILVSTIIAGIVYCPKDYDDGLESFCKGWNENKNTGPKDGVKGWTHRWKKRLCNRDVPKDIEHRSKFPTYPPEQPYRPKCLKDCINTEGSIPNFAKTPGDIDDYNKLLLNSIINNSNLSDDKSQCFRYVLGLLVIGLIFVLIGYYL